MNTDKKIFRLRDMMSMPRGIEMKEFVHADGSITFIGQYMNKSGSPHDKPKRVYKIEVRAEALASMMIANVPWFKGKKCWGAYIYEDDTRIAKIDGYVKKWEVAYAALGALGGILHRRCVGTSSNRKAKRAMKAAEAAAANNPVNSVNPVSKNKEA